MPIVIAENQNVKNEESSDLTKGTNLDYQLTNFDIAPKAFSTLPRVAAKSAQIRDSAADTLVDRVRANPFGTLAAVIGIGFLAGYLCRRN